LSFSSMGPLQTARSKAAPEVRGETGLSIERVVTYYTLTRIHE
jgi:hypothetical protein